MNAYYSSTCTYSPMIETESSEKSDDERLLFIDIDAVQESV